MVYIEDQTPGSAHRDCILTHQRTELQPSNKLSLDTRLVILLKSLSVSLDVILFLFQSMTSTLLSFLVQGASRLRN